jgi:hypothetical protein
MAFKMINIKSRNSMEIPVVSHLKPCPGWALDRENRKGQKGSSEEDLLSQLWLTRAWSITAAL